MRGIDGIGGYRAVLTLELWVDANQVRVPRSRDSNIGLTVCVSVPDWPRLGQFLIQESKKMFRAVSEFLIM